MTDEEITEFLEKVYAEPSKDDALDLILDFVGDLVAWEKTFNDVMAMYGGPRILEEPEYVVDLDAVARMFELIDLARLNSTEMTGFLCSTLAYKHNFPERDVFVDKVRKKLLAGGRGSDSVDSLLKGLE